MLDHLTAYWYLWLLLAAAVAGALLLWRKAMAASKRQAARREAERAVLRHEAAIRRDYEGISADALRTAPDDTIWEGTVAHIQCALEKQGDINAAFSRLPVCARAVYAAYYVQEGAQDGLRAFFRANGEPLTGAAPAALREIGAEAAARATAQEYGMFDESNETASVCDAALDEQDAAFRRAMGTENLARLADAYIRAHARELTQDLLRNETAD